MSQVAAINAYSVVLRGSHLPVECRIPGRGRPSLPIARANTACEQQLRPDFTTADSTLLREPCNKWSEIMKCAEQAMAYCMMSDLLHYFRDSRTWAPGHLKTEQYRFIESRASRINGYLFDVRVISLYRKSL